MDLFEINPLIDLRWPGFLERQPKASVFHSAGWLKALQRTYGYDPIVYSTSGPGKELRNGQVFCRINSWLTGRRLVSVPFSDHADILIKQPDELEGVLQGVKQKLKKDGGKYIELRPTELREADSSFSESEEFCWHKLCLEPDLDTLYQGFHKSCIQRKIRRAMREKLDYTEGRSELLIRQYYRLLMLTHSRHHLPPQPIAWFRNLVDCMGEAIKIRIASQEGVPIAGVVTLTYRDTMVYKYGSSDSSYHNLGGMMLLFWKAIQEAKALGLKELDLGRSDIDNAGLIAFKDHWGATRSTLKYFRYPAAAQAYTSKWQLRWAKRVFGMVPVSTLPLAGDLLYRHAG